MKCPRCESERLTSELLPYCDKWSLEFEIWCLDCGVHWKDSKTIHPSIPPEVEKYWANVEDPIARYAREKREIQKGLDEGKCPKCGDPLVRRERQSAESPAYIYQDAVCKKCKWSYFASVIYEDWAEEKRRKAAEGGME